MRSGETLEKIMFTYSLTKDELVESNRHVRNWKELIPGSKLKIPVITENIDDDIMDMEPFIEDYYPKQNSIDKILSTVEELDEIKLTSENTLEESKTKNIDSLNEESNEDFIEYKEKTREKSINNENKKGNNHKLDYYPYYYYDPYYKQYYVYYYPVYSKTDK